MKDLLRLLILFITVLVATSSVSVQKTVFDPSSGKAVYHTTDGGIVAYNPMNGGSVIDGGKNRTTVDCVTNESQCRSILEDEVKGTPPFIPKEPAEGGDDSGDGDGAKMLKLPQNPASYRIRSLKNLKFTQGQTEEECTIEAI